MNKVRLLKLAELLEADAANPTGVKFDLRAWGAPADSPRLGELDHTYSYSTGEVVPVDCGTAACAVGLAAISGAFKDEGFGYRIGMSGQLLPTCDGWDGWDAVRMFFDLSWDEAVKLFYSESYLDNFKGAESELAVAKRIRDTIA